MTRARWVVLLIIVTPVVWYAWRLHHSKPEGLPSEWSRAPMSAVELIGRYSDAVGSNANSPEVWGELGMAFHANLLNDEAEKCYQRAAELDRDGVTWLYALSLLREEKGDLPGVIELLGRVTAREPENSLAWYRLGEAMVRQGEEQGAAAAYQRAMAIRRSEASTPVRVHAAMGLSRLLMRQGEVESARKVLEAAVAARPTFGPGHRLLAELMEGAGQAEAALDHRIAAHQLPRFSPPEDPMMDRIVGLSRSVKFILWQVGEAVRAGDRARVEALLNRVYAIAPDDPDVLSQIGRMFAGRQQFAEALNVYERLLKVAEDPRAAKAEMGKCLQKLGRAGEAEAVFREMLREDDVQSQVNLAIVLLSQEKTDEAIAMLERAVAMNPQLATAHRSLGAALVTQGRLEEAEKHLAEAARIEPLDADHRRNLGAVLVERGRYAEAIAAYRMAVRIEPGSLDAMEQLAWILATCPEDSLRDGQEAVKLATRVSEASQHQMGADLNVLAAACAEAGRFEEAVKWSKRAEGIARQLGMKAEEREAAARTGMYQAGRAYRMRIGNDE